jgi:spore maturation protein CgeB
MYELLKFAHITFNIHTDAVHNEVANMRMFETTGVGGCLLTDTGANLTDLFEADTEVVTYKSVDECVEKVSYLRDNKKVRDEIARAGQKRTLEQHTTYHRCIEIQEHLDTSV